MAWRLHDLVVEGELDNTTPDIVKGWIRFSDRPDVVRLFLRGDCHPDLAGWRFKIKRRREVPPWAEPADSTRLATQQTGHAGDITADQTLRDSDCSVDELLARMRAGEPPPHIMRKALYLEWYSAQNGRVVIQDTRLGVERLGQRAFARTPKDMQQEEDEHEQDELLWAEPAVEGFQVRSISFGPPPYWPSDVEIDEQFGPEVLAICLDPRRGPVEAALRRLPAADLSRQPFPGLDIEIHIPDLPLRRRRRKIRELFDPPLAPPPASQLTQQRAAVELRKTELLLLSWNIRIEVCRHFDPKFALEWAECSVLWADVPESLSNADQAQPVVFRSSDNCEDCRQELGERWREPY